MRNSLLLFTFIQARPIANQWKSGNWPLDATFGMKCGKA